MKRLKVGLFSIFSIVGILAIIHPINPDTQHPKVQKMKLINLKSQFVVVEYCGDKTIINDRILEKEMILRGVAIPPPLRSEFNGKDSVRLDDKEFQKAFKEIYSPQVFNPKGYNWEE